MSWWVALSGGMALLLTLFLLGVPIFVAFVVLNVIGVFVFFGVSGFGLFANSIYSTATLGALSAVPLFIVMGEIMFRSGAMDVLFDSLDRLIGRIRGRQYVLCIVLSAILGALSGAAMAVAGLLGRSLFPTMRKRGYDTQFSAGTILAGASLDPIIPPSVLAVIIATLADVSAGKMLIAGILPGLLLTGMFLIYVLIRVRITPSLAPDVAADAADRKTQGSVLMALARMIPSAYVFFMVMGLIMLGVATPTEAAATGVMGALLLAAYYRGLSWKMLTEALASAATVASLLLIIMCSAVMFSQLLTFSGATRALGQFVVGLELPAALMLLAMMALPFVLFMFLDQVALMLVLIPIYQPIIRIYQFDEIWFWTLFLVVATVGGLTPPFGYVLFTLKSAAPDVPMTTIFRASWPFVWIICGGMLVMALVPDIITLLPRLMGPR
jgi:tripartite ATP-independent transporter DctM subunit